MIEPTLAVNRLKTGYGDIVAVADVSMKVFKGNVVAILGVNGAGKSTTLKGISGLLPIKSGSVRFKGEEMGGLRPDQIAKRGLIQIPEGRRIFPDLTVKENLYLGTYARGSRDKLDLMFEYFPILKKRMNQLGGTLSGGEQQMLAISRGLLAEPEMLMIDELSLGLAPKIVFEIYDVIRELAKNGLTLLLVEQNSHIVLDIADYGYVLSNGNVVMEGNSQELQSEERLLASYLGHK